MKNKDIDKAAREYCEREFPDDSDPYDAYTTGLQHGCINGFKAGSEFGAQSRQPEIDELIEAQIWRDVDVERPSHCDVVLVRYRRANDTEEYGVAKYMDRWGTTAFLMRGRGKHPKFITHWRPIDTPKVAQLLEKYGKK